MGDTMTAPTYPAAICAPCGEKHGRRSLATYISTWHMATCDICGKLDSVTEPRDFGHLRKTWKDDIPKARHADP